MARQRHLRNAPIVEAIIDFQVRLPIDFDIKKGFGSLTKELSDRYPKVEKGKRVTGSIEIKDGIPVVETHRERGIKGYKFTSKDKREVVQFRIDEFTFSRLRPYTKWELVIGEAKKLWELYSLKSSPQIIERVSLHYINIIDIPLKSDLEEYFTASPVLPKTLPQILNGFFSSLVVSAKDLKVDIKQTIIKSPKPEHIGIILDIDVFKESVNGISDKRIWPMMDRMRKLKNRFFFNLITEKTARLFE